LDTNSYALSKRLLKGYISPHKSRLIVAMFCMVIVALSTAVIAYLVKPILDEIFINKNESLLYIIPIILIIVYVVKGVAGYVQSYFMEYIGQRIVADLQIDLYDHVVCQDVAFFSENNTGSLTSRFLFDLHRLKQAISQTITGSLRDMTTVIGLIVVMFIQDWKLALMSFTIFPLAIYPIIRFGKHMRRYAVGQQEEMGSLSAILKESFSHNRQVKIYTMEPYETERATKSINTVFKLMVKAAKVRALSSPIMELLGGFSMAFIIIYGGTRVMDEIITTGAFFSFLTALMSLYRPIKGLANINNVLQEGLASAQRTFELMDQKAKIIDIENAKDLNLKKAEIEFKNITFSYGDDVVIKDFNLKITQGETIALVGSSGAGKTTILNMVPRFFDPSKGQVNISGQNIKTVSIKSLRENISLVTQDIAVFDDTVYNNIAYGRPSATKAEIIEAAKAAAAHEFINEMEEGYETRLGEDGNTLSGGQKQRIAIARAILKNAPILLLDEATSSLDTESEQQVQKALKSLMKGRTTLVVAHRLSTVVHADTICVMKKGKIIEQGSHSDLMAKQGAYKNLYKIQEVA
jgi:subfamily B ATP-binding cassette protein MsbA